MLKLTVGQSGSTRLNLMADDGSEILLSSVASVTAISNRVKVASARIEDGRVVVTALAAGDATVRVSVGGGGPTRLLLVFVEDADKTPTTRAIRAPAAAPLAPVAPSRPVVELRALVDQVHLVAGEQERLRVDAYDASRAVVADAGVRYLSLNRAFVLVDSISGELSALAPGSATISVILPGTPLAIGVAVTVEAPQLRFEEDTFFIYPGVLDTLRLLSRSGQRAYRGMRAWSSSNTAVAEVEPGTGILTAITPGTATVSAQAPGWVGNTTVVVLARESWHTFQTTAESTMILPLSGRRALAAVGLDSTKQDTLHQLPVEWRVADTSVAILDQNGTGTVLVGRKTGTTVLTARVRTIRWDRTPLVYSWPVRVIGGAITLSPARIGLRVGGRETVSVAMLDSLNRPLPLTVPVDWRVEPSGLVRQIGPGIFEAIGVGRATISARTGWDSTASAIVVVAPDLVFVSVFKTATGAVQRELRGLDLRFMVHRALGQGSGREDQPAVSPDRTRILYTSRVGTQESDIWMMDADGTDRVNLTADPSGDFSPIWSSDGSRIYFVSTRTGVRRVYQTDPSGGPPQPVTDSTKWVQSVAASPDGKWLVYSSRRGEQYDLYGIPLRDGSPSGAEQLIVGNRGNDVLPRYATATGDLYYLSQGASGSVLMRRKPDAAAPDTLTDRSIRVLDFAVAPEGDRVVLVASRPGDKTRTPRAALFLLDLRSGLMTLGAPLLDEPGVSYSAPAFTPR